MSEETKSPRTVEDVQRDYSNLCTKAGHIQYQIDTLSKDLDLLNQSRRDLNNEAFNINAQAAVAKEGA